MKKSIISASQRNSTQTEGQSPVARIVNGKPTGNQSVIKDVIIVRQITHPKTKNKITARISFLRLGNRKDSLENDFIFKVLS